MTGRPLGVNEAGAVRGVDGREASPGQQTLLGEGGEGPPAPGGAQFPAMDFSHAMNLSEPTRPSIGIAPRHAGDHMAGNDGRPSKAAVGGGGRDGDRGRG